MKSEAPNPPPPTRCMACRSAPARYYGTWAAEGLCRACILRMPPDIQVKVLRDMHPLDRRRWQVDDLYKRGMGAKGPTKGAAVGGSEREVSRLLEATESGSQGRLEEEAVRAGVKVVTDEKKPE